MKLRYKKYGAIVRPVISLRLTYRNKSILSEVLIDSGSDESLLDVSFATEFGIELEKGEMRKAVGIGGQSITYFIHTVDMEIGGEVYPTEIGFIPRGPADYGIAGQKGFFDKFVVKSDLLKEEIELQPHQ